MKLIPWLKMNHRFLERFASRCYGTDLVELNGSQIFYSGRNFLRIGVYSEKQIHARRASNKSAGPCGRTLFEPVHSASLTGQFPKLNLHTNQPID